MADDANVKVTVLTPERVLFDGRASEVILRTGEGDATFLDGHTPLVGSVDPGVVRIAPADGDELRFAVHGGYLQVDTITADAAGPDGPSPAADAGSTRVTLLAPVAEPVGEIDVARARAALEAGQARVAELGGSGAAASTSVSGDEDGIVDVELAEAEAAVRRAEVRLEATDAAEASAGGAAGGSDH